MKKSNYKQIHIRLTTDEEIAMYEQYLLIIKKRWRKKVKRGVTTDQKKSINSTLKSMLLASIKAEMENKEVAIKNTIWKDTIAAVLDEQIVPRIYGMVKTSNNTELVKLLALDKKINFMINELGASKLVDSNPIINDIEEKVEQKPWMLEEEMKIVDEIYIKENNK